MGSIAKPVRSFNILIERLRSGLALALGLGSRSRSRLRLRLRFPQPVQERRQPHCGSAPNKPGMLVYERCVYVTSVYKCTRMYIWTYLCMYAVAHAHTNIPVHVTYVKYVHVVCKIFYPTGTGIML